MWRRPIATITGEAAGSREPITMQTTQRKTSRAGDGGILYGLIEEYVYDSFGGVAVPFLRDASRTGVAVEN
jgi:hypothetical protein